MAAADRFLTMFVKRDRHGGDAGEHCEAIALRDVLAEFLALEKDNAAIGAGLVSKVYIGFEPSPAKDFDGVAGDLSRCAVERAIEGLEIGENLIVGGLTLVADGDTRELTSEVTNRMESTFTGPSEGVPVFSS